MFIQYPKLPTGIFRTCTWRTSSWPHWSVIAASGNLIASENYFPLESAARAEKSPIFRAMQLEIMSATRRLCGLFFNSLCRLTDLLPFFHEARRKFVTFDWFL